MIRASLLLAALTLSACCPPPKPTICPPCARATAAEPTPAPKPRLQPAPRPKPAPDPPVKVKPARRLSSNCQAPLPLTEEVSRLLIKAAAHSTSSSACVDGPGTRVAVDRILVCPKNVRKDSAVVEASYRVGQFAEGDTRMCGSRPGACAWLEPRFSEHLTTFQFKGKGKVLRMVLRLRLDMLDQVERGSAAELPRRVKRLCDRVVRFQLEARQCI